jgi:primosomal protein N'
LLTQVAGRAGRAASGIVLIQTSASEHYAVRFASAQDYRLFYRRNSSSDARCAIRRSARWPTSLVRDEDNPRRCG